MRVTLHVVAGPQTGRDFTFDQHNTFMIGRSEDAQFCLPQDRYFSRHHCILEIAPPQAFLRDLGSTNGTYVNGMRVDTAHLKNLLHGLSSPSDGSKNIKNIQGIPQGSKQKIAHF